MSLTMSQPEAAAYNRVRLELKALVEGCVNPPRDRELHASRLRTELRKMTTKFWLHDIHLENDRLRSLPNAFQFNVTQAPMRSLVTGTMVTIASPDE